MKSVKHARRVIADDFGSGWIEIRGMWLKNVAELDANEIADVQKILDKYKLRVTNIASPLFKTAWPGTPCPKDTNIMTSSGEVSVSPNDGLIIASSKPGPFAQTMSVASISGVLTIRNYAAKPSTQT